MQLLSWHGKVLIYCECRTTMCETKKFLCELNAEDFSEHLVEKGVHDDVSALFKSNRISGKIFLQLSEDNLLETEC